MMRVDKAIFKYATKNLRIQKHPDTCGGHASQHHSISTVLIGSWCCCTDRLLSLAWHEWFSCKGKGWKIYCCELALSSEPQIWKFHVVIYQTTSKHCTQKRAANAARLYLFIQPIKLLIFWCCRWRCRHCLFVGSLSDIKIFLKSCNSWNIHIYANFRTLQLWYYPLALTII